MQTTLNDEQQMKYCLNIAWSNTQNIALANHASLMPNKQYPKNSINPPAIDMPLKSPTNNVYSKIHSIRSNDAKKKTPKQFQYEKY